MSAKKFVFFDFDGTLADTIPAIREAVNATLLHFGYPELDYNGVRAGINNGVRVLCRAILPAEQRQNEALVDSVVEYYMSAYFETYLHTKSAYDGIPEALSMLKKHGYRLGIITNKSDEFLKNLTSNLFEDGIFEICAGPVGNGPRKPTREFTESVISRLDKRPSPGDCIMIGDSEVDYYTAKNYGMTFIGAGWGYRGTQYLTETGAENVAKTPYDILGIIEKQEAKDTV